LDQLNDAMKAKCLHLAKEKVFFHHNNAPAQLQSQNYMDVLRIGSTRIVFRFHHLLQFPLSKREEKLEREAFLSKKKKFSFSSFISFFYFFPFKKEKIFLFLLYFFL